MSGCCFGKYTVVLQIKMRTVILPLLVALFSVGYGAMTGAPSVIDMTDEGAQNALSFAVVQYNKGSNSLFYTKAGHVEKVTKQLVAGLLYTFTVDMGRTACRQGEANELCEIHEDPTQAQLQRCIFKVYYIPWQNITKLTKQECS